MAKALYTGRQAQSYVTKLVVVHVYLHVGLQEPPMTLVLQTVQHCCYMSWLNSGVAIATQGVLWLRWVLLGVHVTVEVSNLMPSQRHKAREHAALKCWDLEDS